MRRKAKPNSFNPDRDYVSQAVQEYLEKGGTIKQLHAADAPVFIDSFHRVRDRREKRGR